MSHLCRWNLGVINYCPQTKFAKVTFLHLSVSHSVHRGVSASVRDGIHPPGKQTTPRSRHPSGSRHPRPEADTPRKQTAPRSRYLLGSRHPPPAQCMLGDMGNKRVVRILLECILVVYKIYSVELVNRQLIPQ